MHDQRSLHTRLRHHSPSRLAGVLFLLVTLAACSAPATKNLTLLPPPTFLTAFRLGLPAAALTSPVKGVLPERTPLHVGLTFKINQAVLNQLKKVGQGSNLETSANTLGISDEVYQQIKAYFGLSDARLKLDGLHTYLTIDAPAKTFAQVFQISFVLRTFHGRTFFAPSSDPKLPRFLSPSVLAITGLDSFVIMRRACRKLGSTTALISSGGEAGRDRE